MSKMTSFKLLQGAIVVAALVSAPVVFADPSASNPGMKTALAKAAQGPDHLRWYVQRTKTIYALDYNEVMAAAQAVQTAGADEPTAVAQAGTR